ncbi:hypothetical protein MMC29_006785 [Sticta canariensis]|nr:hypothetical protein [Sticta canariensis]
MVNWCGWDPTCCPSGIRPRFGTSTASRRSSEKYAAPDEIIPAHGAGGRALLISVVKQWDFYHVILPFSKGKVKPGMLAMQDENLHRILKRLIASIYSMSNLVTLEKDVDSTMQIVFEQLDQRLVRSELVCNFGLWIQMLAFDVIGQITLSKRLGFLERAEDVDGIMAGTWNHFKYTAPVCVASRR